MGTAPSGSGKGRFGHHGIAFQQVQGGIDPAHGTGKHFSEKVMESFEDPVAAKLQLGQVASLMDGQIEFPGHRDGIVCVIDRVQVHAARGQDYGTIGPGQVGMQDDRRDFLVFFSGKVADGCAGGRIPFFQQMAIHPGQGIASGCVNELVMLGLKGIPLDLGRIGSGDGNLSLERKPQGYGQDQRGEVNPGKSHDGSL